MKCMHEIDERHSAICEEPGEPDSCPICLKAERDLLLPLAHRWNHVYLLWSSQRQCMDAQQKLVTLVMRLFDEQRGA